MVFVLCKGVKKPDPFSFVMSMLFCIAAKYSLNKRKNICSDSCVIIVFLPLVLQVAGRELDGLHQLLWH